jgi:hypothetical protein
VSMSMGLFGVLGRPFIWFRQNVFQIVPPMFN